MNQLFQALDIAIVKELFLKVRYWTAVGVDLASLGGGALRRCHRHVARRRGLHLAVASRGKLYPLRVRVDGASEKCAQPQISVGEAVGIGRESDVVRCGLIKQRNAWVERQAEIGIAEAGKQRSRIGCGASVGLARRQGGRPSVEMA